MTARIKFTGTESLLAGDPASNESGAAIQSCNDYLRMGPRRSLKALAERYKKNKDNAATPCLSLTTMEHWSMEHSWQARALAYDKIIEEARQVEFEEATQTGVATAAGRINDLKWLRDILREQIAEIDDTRTGGLRYKGLWLRDVRTIGRGDAAQVEEVFRFNSGLVSEFRNTLADLAAEVGGRNIKEAGTPGEDAANRGIRELGAKINELVPQLNEES